LIFFNLCKVKIPKMLVITYLGRFIKFYLQCEFVHI